MYLKLPDLSFKGKFQWLLTYFNTTGSWPERLSSKSVFCNFQGQIFHFQCWVLVCRKRDMKNIHYQVGIYTLHWPNSLMFFFKLVSRQNERFLQIIILITTFYQIFSWPFIQILFLNINYIAVVIEYSIFNLSLGNHNRYFLHCKLQAIWF